MSRQVGWAAVCETGRIKHTRTANEFVRLPTHKKCYPGCDNASRLIAFLVNADYGPSKLLQFLPTNSPFASPVHKQSPSEAEMTGPRTPRIHPLPYTLPTNSHSTTSCPSRHEWRPHRGQKLKTRFPQLLRRRLFPPKTDPFASSSVSPVVLVI